MSVVQVMVLVAVNGVEDMAEMTGGVSMVTVALHVPEPPLPETLRV